MQVKLDHAVPASGITSGWSTPSVSKSPNSSPHGLNHASSRTKTGQCNSGITAVKDVVDKQSTENHDFVDSKVDRLLDSIDFCRSAAPSAEKKNSVTVSCIQSSPSTVVQTSSTNHGKFTTSLTSVPTTNLIPSVSAITSSTLSVTSPSFVPPFFNKSKQLVPPARNWRSATVVTETGVESVSEVSGKNSECVTVKDNATDSSSAGSFAECSATTYQFSTASSSSSVSSSSQPGCDGISTPCIGRGRKLQQRLLEHAGGGSTQPVPGGLFLHSLSHFVLCMLIPVFEVVVLCMLVFEGVVCV